MLTDQPILVKNKLTNQMGLMGLFEQEREIINHFFDEIDFSSLEQFVDVLKACTGMVILTGVGKSGLVAEKIALTLTSTGTRAFFLSPSNALHGDIGIVAKDDVFVMISKSGESDELLQLVPFLRNRGVKILSIINRPNSRLAKACDLTVHLPLQRELCPFDLVPTTSAITHMILGDVLAVCLMAQNDFGLDQYALNHPAGKIGRRLTFRVKDLMLSGQDIPLCRPDEKLVDTLVELSNKKCGCVLVTDNTHRLLGIFTDGDLRRSLQNRGSKALDGTIGEFMSTTPKQIAPNAMASQALEVMEGDQKRPVTVLPVVDEAGIVVGIIKLHDILQSGI